MEKQTEKVIDNLMTSALQKKEEVKLIRGNTVKPYVC
jgi:hypothetical protein